jgi:hypothetical protein
MLGLLLSSMGAALLLGGVAFHLGTRWARAQRVPTQTAAERLREQAEAAIAQEKLDEVAEVIERRRKRVEAALQRAEQRDARNAPASGAELSGEQVATLSVQEQLAWAARRARHRAFGGGGTLQ